MSIVIIDYGSGNLHSAAKAFEKARDVSNSDQSIIVSSNPKDLLQAERIVLPGVGAYADCKAGLEKVPGLLDTLKEQVLEKRKPFLGICVGMQLMSDKGLEHGQTEGFGWIGGQVEAIQPSDDSLKIPHMGWNTLNVLQEHSLFDGIQTGDDGMHAYFVHSYHFKVRDNADIVAATDYGMPVTAMVAKGNLAGVQFHPEKSQMLGLKLIENFLKWTP